MPTTRTSNTVDSGWTAVVTAATRIDIAQVQREANGRPRVTRCESFPLDKEGLVPTLGRLRQANKLGGRCTTLLPPGDYQLLPVEAPALPATAPATELREAVRWQIKDLVSFPVTAAGIDVLRVPTPSGRPQQLLVAAASHTALRPCIEAYQSARINLAAIDLPEMAQRNIASLFETPDRALALLTFNEQGGLLTVTCNGELYVSRRSDITAQELVAGAANGVYDRVVLEVQRSLDNFERNFSQLSLQKLLVAATPGAEGLIGHLKDSLYQKVESLRIADGLNIDDVPMLANPTTLADALPALGAALRLEALA